MPNYYAHLRFGGQVLGALSPEVRGPLLPFRPAFDLGCLGPDPLYFSGRRAVRAEGRALHRLPGGAVLEDLRRRLAADPAQLAYGAGFFCHYALDAACHPYIVRTGGHLPLEAGLDRALLRADGLGRFRWPRADPAALEAAQAAYRQADALALGGGYWGMSVNARLLGRLWRRADGVLPRIAAAAVRPAALRLTQYLSGAPLDAWYDRDFYGSRPQT